MTIDEAIKDLEYGSEQLEMEIESGLWIKGSEPELRCKEGIALNKQHIEWLKELKDLREENKVLIQKCDKLIKEKGADVQPVKHGQFKAYSEKEQYEVFKKLHINFDGCCSECNSNMFESDKFCAGCGAMMDGDYE